MKRAGFHSSTDNIATTSKLLKIQEQKHSSSGLRHTLHGNIYQLKLLMLFLYRGLNNEYSFRLATEYDPCEKFDDLFFEYKFGTGKIYRFLQAKHKLDDNKKITYTELMTDKDGEFSLQKYFNSYRKIIKYSEFTGVNNQFKDFIICTNIDLEKSLHNYFEPVGDVDPILITEDNNSKRLKLKTGDFYDEILLMLGDTSDLHRLAKKLVQSNKLHLSDALFQFYQVVLVQEILEFYKDGKGIHFAKFSTNFLDKNKYMKFKELLLKSLQKEKKLTNLQKWKIQTTAKFKKIDRNLVQALPDDQIDTKEIKDFLNKLVFAVNQPNEIELGKIIEDEISDNELINILDNRFIGSLFERDMLDWMKNKEGTFITHEDGNQFLKRAIHNLSKLILIGPTLDYCALIDEFGVIFNEDVYADLKLDEFLNPKGNELILNIITKNTKLTSVKVYQILKDLPEYKKDDTYIFLNLSTLMRMKDRVIMALDSNNLLVTVCEHGKITKLKNFLKEIIKIYPNKRIITITEKIEGQFSAFALLFYNQMPFIGKYKEYEDEKINFINLRNESRENLLQKYIKFQGIEVRLGLLLEESLYNFIDENVLFKLISDEEIKIGNELIDLGDVKNYYIERKFYRCIKIYETVEKETEKFFIISNIRNSEPKPQQDILLITDFHDEDQFKTLCIKYNNKNIHWIKKENAVLKWQQSHGNLSKLRDFVFIEENYLPQNVDHQYISFDSDDSDNSDEFDETDPEPSMHDREKNNLAMNTVSDKLIIIVAEPGMGKSTVITQLAIKTKETDPLLWILRINLIDFSTKFSKWDEEQINIIKAKKFIYSCAILNKIQEDQDQQRNGLNLFETEIFNEFYNDHKIVLLFDGFDEISPDYKMKVIKLLKVLAKEKFKQLWVTTRPYAIQNQLENELGTFSYLLESISLKNQIIFLKNYWKFNLNLNKISKSSIRYIQTLLEAFSRATNDKDNEFAVTPLQLTMFAEYDQDKFVEYLNSDNNETAYFVKAPIFFNLLNLYEHFVSKKFDKIRWEDKKPGINRNEPDMKNAIENERKKFLENHKMLAVYALFGENISNMISDVSYLLTEINDGKNKNGIIDRVVDHKPIFVHKSFAEYFLALWLADNWEICDKVKSFLREIIFIKENKIIRNFFDSMMIQDNNEINKYELHQAIINGDRYQANSLFRNHNSQNKTKIINLLDKAGRSAFHLALSYNDITVIDDFLDSEHRSLIDNINLPDKIFGWSPLIYAEKFNNWKAAELILQSGGNGDELLFQIINCVDGLGEIVNSEQTLLKMFNEEKFVKLSQILIKKHLDIFEQNSNDPNPLYGVAFDGNLDMVKYFVKNGLNVNSNVVVKKSLENILHGAVRGRNIDVVKYLVNKGANINATNVDYDETVLNFVAKKGYLDIIKYFLEETDAEIINNKYGENAIHSASKCPNSEIFQYCINYLEKNKPDELLKFINAKGKYDRTPAYYAATYRNTENLKCIINSIEKTYPDQLLKFFTNKIGSVGSLLHWTVSPGNKEMVQFLIEKFIEKQFKEMTLWDFITEKPNLQGNIPLYTVVRHDQLDIFEYFLTLLTEYYPDKLSDYIYFENDEGESPISYAIQLNRISLVKSFLNKSDDIFKLNKKNETILHLATQLYEDEVFNLILNKIKNTKHDIMKFINLTNNYGRSALMIAVIYQRIKKCAILLENGANPNIQDENNDTAMHWAVQAECLNIIKLLLSKNANSIIKNKDEKSSLDLAKEQIKKNKENKELKEIIHLLANHKEIL